MKMNDFERQIYLLGKMDLLLDQSKIVGKQLDTLNKKLAKAREQHDK